MGGGGGGERGAVPPPPLGFSYMVEINFSADALVCKNNFISTPGSLWSEFKNNPSFGRRTKSQIFNFNILEQIFAVNSVKKIAARVPRN